MSDVLPRIEVPPLKRATPEEIARRRKLFEGVLRLREGMPPPGFDAAELIRELRDLSSMHQARSSGTCTTKSSLRKPSPSSEISASSPWLWLVSAGGFGVDGVPSPRSGILSKAIAHWSLSYWSG